MKRVAYLLIIAASFIAICCGADDVQNSPARGGPQFSILLTGENFAGTVAEDGQATTLDNPITLLEPPGKSFLTPNKPSISALDKYFIWGLGCGGLPS